MTLSLTYRTVVGCVAGAVALAGFSLASINHRRVGPLPNGLEPKADSSQLRTQLAQLPLAFERNEGQTDPRVHYLSRGPGYSLFLTPDEAVLRLQSGEASGSVEAHSAVRMRLTRTKRLPVVTPEARLAGYSHYYLGNNPKSWRQKVERFARVRYAGVYDGVDLVYYGRQGQLEYDYLVQPGADPGQIRLRIGGADNVRLTPEGDLRIQTPSGELKQHRPYVYQEIGGIRKPVSGRYVLASSNVGQEPEVHFGLGSYDRSRPLVIDPVLSFSTYLGGGGADQGSDIKVDAEGYVYVTGRTASINFPVANPQQGFIGGGGQSGAEGTDTFITKLTPAGDALVYSTYLGGTGLDFGNGLALDADRNAYVTGQTGSINFPVQGALQAQYGGGLYDAFLTKLDPAGFLVFSTYLGGTGSDISWSALHDGQGSVYLGGSTTSLNFPTLNALQGAHANTGTSTASLEDAFVTKVNGDGSALQFSTYLGASGRDSCQGLAFDPSGNLCIGGDTTSTNFPVTASAKQPANAGRTDAFFTKLSPDGLTPLYSTYFGGNYEDRLYGFGVDGLGNVYLSGFTFSTNLPTTFGAIGTVYHGGNSDGYLAKLNAAGNAYVYVTYLGSSGSIEYAYDLAPDAVGNVYVAGYTDSTSFFPLASPYQEYSNSLDGYVMRLDPAGKLLYSTYLGGMSDNTADYIFGITADAAGNAYVTGRTYSRNWPLVNPLQAVSGSPTSGDAFVVKLSPLHTVSPDVLQAKAISKTDAELTWVDRSNNETGFSLERSTNAVNYTVIATLAPDTTRYVDPARSPGATYWYRLRAFNAEGYTNYASGAVIMPPDVPAAPTNLTVTPLSANTLRLTWTDNSDNETRFDVYRSYDNGVNYGIIQYLGANTTTYDDANLAANTVYYYRVYASTSSASTVSNTASGQTLTSPPAAPANLQVSVPGNNQLRVTWTDISNNETGFKIDRSPDGITWNRTVSIDTANVTTFLDDGLPAGTTFYYRVRSYNAGGESANTTVASGTTNPPPPAAPSNLTVQEIGTTSVSLRWQDNSGTETGFRVRRSAVSIPVVEIPIAANETSFLDTGIHSNTTYTYQVYAYNPYGSSAATAPVSALTLPAAPSSLTGTATSTRVDLHWTDNNTFSPAAIQVERSDDSGATFTALATATAGAGGYADTTVQEDRTYHYRVRAMNSSGNSPYAAPLQITTPLDPPAAPTALTATYSRDTRRVSLAWTDRSSNEAGFQVERSADSGATWTPLASVSAGVTQYNDASWQPDAVHGYRVRAFNRAGASGYTNLASLAMPPAAPSGLTAGTVSSRQILLRWADNSSREEAYVIERKTGIEPFREVSVVAGNSTLAYDADLAPDTLYTYRVRARNAVDLSSPSNEAFARTLPDPPAAPTGLTVRALVQGELSLSWTDNSSNEDGFRVELWDGTRFNVLANVGANLTTYTHRGLAGNTSYTYQVHAYNQGGLSGSQETVGVQTLPSTPSNLTARTVSQTELDLSWTDTNPNPCGHQIERSKDGVTFAYRELVLPGVTSYPDTGLEPGTRYYYRVRAVNGAGSTPYSNTANAVTQLPPPPAAPSNLVGTELSPTQVRLTWRDNSGNESEFRIERSTDGTRFTQVGTVAANVTQFTSSGLTGNTKYWFRVRAANAGGTSGYTNTVNVRTRKK